MAEEAKWYVVHTYSGYENKVASNLEKTVENRQLQELIQEIRVPTETVPELTEAGDGKCGGPKIVQAHPAYGGRGGPAGH